MRVISASEILATAELARNAYIASWLEVLRQDKQEIFRAAAQAQQACDYLQQKALVAAPLASARETTTEPEPAMVITESQKQLAR